MRSYWNHLRKSNPREHDTNARCKVVSAWQGCGSHQRDRNSLKRFNFWKTRVACEGHASTGVPPVLGLQKPLACSRPVENQAAQPGCVP